MISREQLKLDIDAVDEAHIEILHRIIQALKTTKLTPLNPPMSSEINPLKDSILFEKDLISPIDVSWDAEQ